MQNINIEAIDNFGRVEELRRRVREEIIEVQEAQHRDPINPINEEDLFLHQQEHLNANIIWGDPGEAYTYFEKSAKSEKKSSKKELIESFKKRIEGIYNQFFFKDMESIIGYGLSDAYIDLGRLLLMGVDEPNSLCPEGISKDTMRCILRLKNDNVRIGVASQLMYYGAIASNVSQKK